MALGPLPVEGTANVAGGLVMVALALWLAFLDTRNTLNRSFALFFVLRGVMNVVEGYGALEAGAGYWSRVHVYLSIAVLFAGLHFAHTYWRRYGAPGRTGLMVGRWPTAMLLAATVVLEAAYVLDHGLHRDGDGVGPLMALTPLRIASYALVAVVLAGDYAAAPAGPRRRSLLLVVIGFALTPLSILPYDVYATYAGLLDPSLPAPPILFDLTYPVDQPGVLAAVLVASALSDVLCAVLVVRLVRHARSAESAAARAETWRAVAVLLFAVGAGVVGVATFLNAGRGGTVLANVLDGTLVLVQPCLVAYAIVRHQLFGLDVKIKFTLRQSTVAAIFLVVFFVVSEGAQELFSEKAGPFVGIGAAAALLFALAPLQRFAERVADSAMPGVHPVGELDLDQRMAVYRAQAEVAWSDGAITADERRMLEAAREKLGLSYEQCARIERDLIAT